MGNIAGIAMQDKRGAVRLGRRNKPGVQPFAVRRVQGQRRVVQAVVARGGLNLTTDLRVIGELFLEKNSSAAIPP